MTHQGPSREPLISSTQHQKSAVKTLGLNKNERNGKGRF